jgi:hypothetical protein
MTTTTHTIGCIFDHGCRSDVELSEDIIEYARGFGFKMEPNAWKYPAEDKEQIMSEASEDAIHYLNSLDLPPYTYYGNDGEAGAFGLWPNLECANGGGVWSDDGVLRVADTSEISHVAHVNDLGLKGPFMWTVRR